jgi:hypothetical protein
MSVVKLKIIEPQHGTDYVDSGAARLHGELSSDGHGTLFYKWYTNLAVPLPPEKSPPPLATALDAQVTLPFGSQTIVLSVKDVAGDAVADIQRVQHAGVSGGAPDTPAPCVVHVLRAIMIEPEADGATLSKANATLSVRVPPLWEDREYQRSVNQLRYSWLFTPAGAPAGRASAELAPAMTFSPPLDAKGDPPSKLVAPLSFNPKYPKGDVPAMRYQGPLPATLGTGNYVLKLRVQKTKGTGAVHEVSRNVVLQA